MLSRGAPAATCRYHGKSAYAACVLLMNAFNFGLSFSTIALYSVALDSDKTFFLMSFRNHDLVSSSELLIKVVPNHI